MAEKAYQENILHPNSQGRVYLLAGPLMCRVLLRTSEILAFGVQHPPYDTVVDGDTNKRAKNLGEKDVPRWNVHVVSDFHVLKL